MGDREWRGSGVTLAIDPDRLTGYVLDNVTGVRWRFDLAEWADDAQPTIDRCHLGDTGLDAELTWRGHRYRVEAHLVTGRPEVLFAVEAAADAPADLAFPGPLSADGALTELALPLKATNGILYRSRSPDEWDLSFNVADSDGLSMPFWSVATAESGLLCVLNTPDDGRLEITKRHHADPSIVPVWRASSGGLRYRRELRVRALPAGGYVDAARAYREMVQEAGRFKSLAEKIDERPVVGQVVGGPYFSTGYLPYSERKFRQVLSGLRELGYRNGLIGPIDFIQWGAGPWVNDYQRFICAPHFNEIAAAAGFAAFGWLYLEDILEWDPWFDPSWPVRDNTGNTLEGWFNRDYSFAQVCTTVIKENGRRLRDRITAYDAIHFDTTTSKSLVECYDPAHAATRGDDKEARRAWLAEVASWGRLIGSEAGWDWAFDVYDFCSSNPRRGLETRFPDEAVHVPLLGLVYHDSIVSYCWEYDPYQKSYFETDWSQDKLLYDLMAGNPPTLSPVMGYFPVIRRPPPPVESRWVTWEDPENQRVLRESLIAALLHGHTAHQQLIDHAYIDDGRLSRTVYSGGTAVYVNTDQTPQQVDGRTVPGRSYSIDGPDLHPDGS